MLFIVILSDSNKIVSTTKKKITKLGSSVTKSSRRVTQEMSCQMYIETPAEASKTTSVLTLVMLLLVPYTDTRPNPLSATFINLVKMNAKLTNITVQEL